MQPAHGSATIHLYNKRCTGFTRQGPNTARFELRMSYIAHGLNTARSKYGSGSALHGPFAARSKLHAVHCAYTVQPKHNTTQTRHHPKTIRPGHSWTQTLRVANATASAAPSNLSIYNSMSFVEHGCTGCGKFCGTVVYAKDERRSCVTLPTRSFVLQAFSCNVCCAPTASEVCSGSFG